jgi:hypothetical protein
MQQLVKAAKELYAYIDTQVELDEVSIEFQPDYSED